MERKAKFITAIKNRNQFDRHAWEHTDLLYEYRGHQYIITKDNNGYMGEPLWLQHKHEQERIDEMIKHENDPIPEYKGSDDWFELFWENENEDGEENEMVPNRID